MKRGRAQSLFALGCVALGCEQVLGIHDTQRGAPVGSGGVSGAPIAVGGEAGSFELGGGAEHQAGDGGASTNMGEAGQAAGSAGESELGGRAGAPSTDKLLSPADIGVAVMLWLDASVGVIADADGAVVEWQDRSLWGQAPIKQHAAPPEPGRAPKWVSNNADAGFGKFPALQFDGHDDKLLLADAPHLQVGVEPFVLEIVLSNLTDQCCQQLVLLKDINVPPYPGITVTVNWWVNIYDTNHYPPTGEYSAFLQFTPDQVSTPFSDAADYRDGKPRVLSMLRTKQELSIRINGQVLDGIASKGIDASAVGQDLVIGGHPGNDQLQFRGSIAEIVFVRGLETADALALDRYLVKKYAAVLKNP